MTASGPKKRHPGQTNAQYNDRAVDPNVRFIEAEASGGLGWGRTDVGGYQPVLVRILRAIARHRDKRRDA